ncbi:AAA domain-containing protein [Fulvivirga sp.]|uniref:AAA domain-containing protein n=1 Tax=Fulvivirga sp. TaxID=1931237 RepID=UPI0032ED0215
MHQIDEQLKKLLTLLKKEKDADLEHYKLKMTSTSYNERRRQGVCWYPVHVEKTDFDAGERPILRVSRPPEHRESHMFQSGKLVSFFSNAQGNDESSEAITGVVNSAGESHMMITLNSDDKPSWIRDGKLGVQLLFDENSYREMERTIKNLIKTEDFRVKHLKNILLGDKQAQFDDATPVTIPGLNPSQNDALNKVLNAHDVAIIHGPPGTGKTTTIIESILQTLKSEKQILVCAPSNAAVDLLVEKLSDRDVNVLRIGHPARVTEEMLGKTLDARVANHPDFKDLKGMRKKAEEFFSMAKKYKRSFGYAEREQRKLLYDEAHQLKDAADQLNYYITNDIIDKAQVIACTLVAANNYNIKGIKFKTAFIDEAGQALEPASWIPILKSGRVIFAGDHFQLPPTIKSYEAAKAGLEVTLFEKAINGNNADVMLKEQYRMNEAIMQFSSNYFYKNELKANASVAHWTVFQGDSPIEFIDTAGTGFFENVDPETRSSYNDEEANLLQNHFNQYIETLEAMDHLKDVDNIGIISPYKAQVTRLKERFAAEGAIPEVLNKKVVVNTIDAFQGQERDIIYISLVRSNERGEIGFLSDTRRMNVAITRARKKLVLIGDSGTIGQNPFYAAFLDYVNENGYYRSAYELMS